MKQRLDWITIGEMDALVANAGVGARVGEEQVAVFYLPELAQPLYAVSNYCPFSEANIIARGIPGDINGEPVVASPLYKQHFSLLDGRCLEHPVVRLRCWRVRQVGHQLQVALGAEEDKAA